MTGPTASVVIPTFNRPDRLAGCLEGLCGLAADRHSFEVLVVDDGSTIELEPMLRPYRQRLELQLIRQQNAGPAAARNTGARHASGHVLAFTDDDCVPDPHWLTELLSCQQDHPTGIIGGRTLNALPGNLFAEASQDLVAYLYDYYAAVSGAPAFFTSNNMMVRRDHFLALGGFSTAFRLAAGEDRELCDRWRSLGHTLHYAERAVIRHYHGLDLRRFWRQHLNYGRGAFHFHAVRRERGAHRTMEPASFYLQLLLFPLRQQRRVPRALAGAVLMALSQAANAAGYFQEKRAARDAPD
jgi:GT2 family glycosyltransferase